MGLRRHVFISGKATPTEGTMLRQAMLHPGGRDGRITVKTVLEDEFGDIQNMTVILEQSLAEIGARLPDGRLDLKRSAVDLLAASMMLKIAGDLPPDYLVRQFADLLTQGFDQLPTARDVAAFIIATRNSA